MSRGTMMLKILQDGLLNDEDQGTIRPKKDTKFKAKSRLQSQKVGTTENGSAKSHDPPIVVGNSEFGSAKSYGNSILEAYDQGQWIQFNDLLSKRVTKRSVEPSAHLMKGNSSQMSINKPRPGTSRHEYSLKVLPGSECMPSFVPQETSLTNISQMSINEQRKSTFTHENPLKRKVPPECENFTYFVPQKTSKKMSMSEPNARISMVKNSTTRKVTPRSESYEPQKTFNHYVNQPKARACRTLFNGLNENITRDWERNREHRQPLISIENLNQANRMNHEFQNNSGVFVSRTEENVHRLLSSMEKEKIGAEYFHPASSNFQPHLLSGIMVDECAQMSDYTPNPQLTMMVDECAQMSDYTPNPQLTINDLPVVFVSSLDDYQRQNMVSLHQVPQSDKGNNNIFEGANEMSTEETSDTAVSSAINYMEHFGALAEKLPSEDEPITRKYESKMTFCDLCEKPIATHFSRHLTTYHSSDSRVSKIMELQSRSEVYSDKIKHILRDIKEAKKKKNFSLVVEIESKNSKVLAECRPIIKKFNLEVRKIVASIRGNGNHKFNLSAPPGGEIIPKKRPNHGKYVPSEVSHATCGHCKFKYYRENLWDHVNKYHSNPESHGFTEPNTDPNFRFFPNQDLDKPVRKRVLRTSAQLMYRGPSEDGEVAELYKKEILGTLKNDLVSVIASTDPLILDVGLRFFHNHREVKDRKAAKSLIRDLARLFMKMEEDDNDIFEFQDCFDPLKFKQLVSAVLHFAEYVPATNEVGVPSINLRYQGPLKSSAEAILSQLEQDKDMSKDERTAKEDKIRKFLHLMGFEWQFRVSSNCEKARKKKSANKEDILALPDDIRLLSDAVEAAYRPVCAAIKENPCQETLIEACELVIVDIMLGSRRRDVEAVKPTIEDYNSRTRQNDHYSTVEVFTQEDIDKTSSLSIFYVIGKNEKRAPILVTELMEQGIESILSARSILGISSKPKDLLFPVPFKPTAQYEATKILAKWVKKYPLKRPEHMTVHGLRHEIATATQAHQRNETYEASLLTFMNHSRGVHDNHYKLPLPTVHKVLIGSRLMSYRSKRASFHGTPSDHVGHNNQESGETDTHDREFSQLDNSSPSNSAVPSRPLVQHTSEENHSSPVNPAVPSSPLVQHTSEENHSAPVNPAVPSSPLVQHTSEENDDEDNISEYAPSDVEVPVYKSKKTAPSIVSDEGGTLQKSRKVPWTQTEIRIVNQYFGEMMKRMIPIKRKNVKEMFDKEQAKFKREFSAVYAYVNNQQTGKYKKSRPISNM